MTETHHAPLPDVYPSSKQPTSSTYSKCKKFGLPLIGLLTLLLAYISSFTKPVPNSTFDVPASPQCKKPQVYRPSFNKSVNLILNDKQFKIDSIRKLSGAIQIPTEISDTNPLPNADPEYYSEFFQTSQIFRRDFSSCSLSSKGGKSQSIGSIIYMGRYRSEFETNIIYGTSRCGAS
ncbi:hypothetical protein VL3_4248 [Saccharomyces cerevisiae VL3]|nr:hypothetical protein VL3_4248 [Saccharomyces cerevisiae VL3]